MAKQKAKWAAVGVVAALSVGAWAATVARADAPQKGVPVIVELFSSEGCSDCPPADALAARLAQTQPVAGADIIVLEEHVDYFNSARWTDPYSSPAFTARQEHYVNRFRQDSTYTPEMVVDGQAEFVGSDAGRAVESIRTAANAATLPVNLTCSRGVVQVRVAPLSSDQTPCDVVLAITETGVSSQVGGGENAGRRLEHSAVVRHLALLGSVESHAAGLTKTVALPLAPSWNRHALRAVVFVQERDSLRIIGAAAVPLG